MQPCISVEARMANVATKINSKNYGNKGITKFESIKIRHEFY
jgi:hypothetical protein